MLLHSVLVSVLIEQCGVEEVKIHVYMGSGLLAWILAAIMLASVILASAGSSYSFSISKSDKPPILLGVYSSSDTNNYLDLTPKSISTGKDMSAVGGYAALRGEEGLTYYGFLALFPSNSFTKFKLLDIRNPDIKNNDNPYVSYSVSVDDVSVISRISGTSGSKSIGNIAGPPTTEVWVLYTTTFWLGIDRKMAVNIAAFNDDGSLKCNNGFILDKLKPGYGSFYSFNPVMVHDRDKAYVIAPIITSSDVYAGNPLIVTRFDAECGLDKYVSRRIATSPDSSVYVYDAIYSNGYIYAVGLYDSGASSSETVPKILLLKISAKTLDIIESKAFIMPWPEEAETRSTKIDVYGGKVAASAYYDAYYSGRNTGGSATIILDTSTLQPIWTSITRLPGVEGSGDVADVIIKDNMVMTIGSLYQGFSFDRPDASKGFVTANMLDTGELVGAYTLGVEGAVVFRDSALQGDMLMVASKWIPGALDAGFQATESEYEILDKDDITIIDLPVSAVTQPLRDAAELTGGLDIIDASSSMKTGYSNLQDGSLYVINSNIKLEETTLGEPITTTTEETKTDSETTTSNEPTSETQTTQNPAETLANTEENDKNGVVDQATDIAEDYLSKYRTELLILIAVIIILAALIITRR